MRRIHIFILIFSLFSGFLIPVNAQQTTEQKAQLDKTSSAKEKTPTTQKVMKQKVKIPLPPTIDELYKKDLNHYLTPEQLQYLLIGSEDILILVKEQTTANAKGVAILVPNWQQVATAPQAINFLRNRLPQQGWTTITIQPPAKPEHYPSTKLNALEQAQENEKTLSRYQEKLNAILLKVMEKAANYPGIFLVIAEGSNAALMVNLYKEKKLGHPAALVLLSAHLLTEKDNQAFAKTLASLEIPVLDLYLERDNNPTIYSAPLRRIESKRQLKMYYQQRQFANFNSGYYPTETLLKVINGWLKRIGW